jgi:hypothetical protein
MNRLLAVLLLCTACAPSPPADFAPAPGLIAQIRQIRIIPTDTKACPGAVIHADYEAVLADGSHVPFARTYDRKHPPALHVTFLDRKSAEATPRQDGDWVAAKNPLATISTGFRLQASLRADSAITSTVVLPPAYDCMDHAFTFWGGPGPAGMRGQDGPDLTVRLAVEHSPFYDKLYVAGIEVGGARPFYVLADSAAIAAEWLSIESHGGDGGDGMAGSSGLDGSMGAPGCPGQAGGRGSDGGRGGDGGNGGDGGRITLVVPPNQPELARFVKTASWGGSGGRGGDGGRAGRGGSGGQGLVDMNTNMPCSNGPDGSAGLDGSSGTNGFPGSSGRTTVAAAASKQPS